MGAYCLINVRSLSDYGVNWDEPVHFGRGQAILRFFLTGKKDYSDLEANPPVRRSFYQSDGYTYTYLESNFDAPSFPIIGAGHPVVSDLLASMTNRIFYGWLGLLGDIEAYHAYSVFLSAVCVGGVVYFTGRHYGIFAGVVAGLSLFLYPLFLGESRFNIKDPAEAVYYALTVLTFFWGVTKNRWPWILLSSLFAGLAFGTKLNIVFLALSLILWIFLLWFNKVRIHGIKVFVHKQKALLISFFSFPIVIGILYFGTWPMLWEDPIRRFLYNLSYYKTVGIGEYQPDFITTFGFNTYAMQWIVYTTPVVILFFAIIGIVWTILQGRREKYKTSLFLFFWFLVPIIRVSLPSTSIYGGVRQIMEYIPPMAMLAGVGAGFLIKIYKNYTRYKHYKDYSFLLQVLILLSFIPITLKMISMHPNESVYFNPIIGGLAGARERNIPGWGNSLGSTYRQGVRWINAHAEEGAKVAMAFELLSSIPKSDFRPDIKYSNLYRSGQKREGEYIIGITHQGDAARYLNYRYVQNFLVPLYQVVVDGVPLLKVWKNDIEHTIPSIIQDTHAITGIEVKRIGDKIIVEFPHVVRLTKLSLFFNERDDCTLPEEGQLFMSVDGQSWSQSAAGNLLESASYVWFKHHSEKGKLMYLFAADYLRYLKFTGIYEATCLHKYPVRVEAEGI